MFKPLTLGWQLPWAFLVWEMLMGGKPEQLIMTCIAIASGHSYTLLKDTLPLPENGGKDYLRTPSLL